MVNRLSNPRALLGLLFAGMLALPCLAARPAQAKGANTAVLDCRAWGMRYDALSLFDRAMTGISKPDPDAKADRDYGRAACHGGLRPEVMTILHHVKPNQGLHRTPLAPTVQASFARS